MDSFRTILLRESLSSRINDLASAGKSLSDVSGLQAVLKNTKSFLNVKNESKLGKMKKLLIEEITAYTTTLTSVAKKLQTNALDDIFKLLQDLEFSITRYYTEMTSGVIDLETV